MTSLHKFLNPFSPSYPKKIETPWGDLEPKVDIFPIAYLIFIYGLVYILPFGKDIIGISWFDWFRSEDGPLEWIQFVAYFLAFLCCSTLVWGKRHLGFKYQTFGWILLALLCFFIAGEEISWGERITGFGFDALRAINVQGESNIHNTAFFHHKLLDPAFEISCLLFGWIGWQVWPNIEIFPPKRYSLYFLLVALFYLYFDLSYASTIRQIRNDQEIFELLMSVGILAHCWNSICMAKITNKKKCPSN